MAEFEALVRKGDEVGGRGLTQRIARAVRLAFLWHDNALIGIAGLKHPDVTYRSRISESAGMTITAGEFPFELGWVFVDEGCRGRGLSRALASCALESIDEGVFATSRSDNCAMHKTLVTLGFERAGNEYTSNYGQYELALFARPRQNLSGTA